MLRGIDRQLIFEDSEDYIRFLDIVQECRELCGFKLYATNSNDPQSMQAGDLTEAKSATVELDLTKYTSSGMNVIFYHNVDFGTDVPCDVYVTALEFITK